MEGDGAMQLGYRQARLDDFEEFFHGIYSPFGCDRSLLGKAAREWEYFRHNPHGLSLVVEDQERPRGERLLGYAEGVFVSTAFAEQIQTKGVPYINSQIVSRMPCTQSPLLTTEAIREANSGDGLCLYLPYFGWREAALTPDEAFQVRVSLHRGLFVSGSGYKFREILIEVAGVLSQQRCQNCGFLLRTDYAAYFKHKPSPPLHLHPYLLSITREEAMTHDGSILSCAFAYKQPRFYFKQRDQELLCYALEGKSDEEIATLLLRTPGNIKKRWLAIYECVGEEMPGLLPPASELGRGPEKRRTLLAYLREHTEELRPLSRPPKQSERQSQIAPLSCAGAPVMW